MVSWRSRWETIRRVGPGQVLLARTWILVRGDSWARSKLRLAPDSLVIDVGAYRGEFAKLMRQEYEARVVAVEPIPQFASDLSKQFGDDTLVTVVAAALGGSTGQVSISLADDGSSAWGDGEDVVMVPLIDVAGLIGTESVDLIKINAEGAEFDILNRLIETDQIVQVNIIQVQFHKFVPGAVAKRKRIRRKLKKTHRCVWSVPWVWEQWCRR